MRRKKVWYNLMRRNGMKKKDDSGAGREEAPIVLYTTPDGAVKVNVLSAA